MPRGGSRMNAGRKRKWTSEIEKTRHAKQKELQSCFSLLPPAPPSKPTSKPKSKPKTSSVPPSPTSSSSSSSSSAPLLPPSSSSSSSYHPESVTASATASCYTHYETTTSIKDEPPRFDPFFSQPQTTTLPPSSMSASGDVHHNLLSSLATSSCSSPSWSSGSTSEPSSSCASSPDIPSSSSFSSSTSKPLSSLMSPVNSPAVSRERAHPSTPVPSSLSVVTSSPSSSSSSSSSPSPCTKQTTQTNGTSADTNDLLKFYCNIVCPFSHRVEILLIEKAVPFERVHIDLGNNKPQKWYYQVNPLGQVPAVWIHNQVFIDSLLIMEYLDSCYPDSPMFPLDQHRRMFVKDLVDFCQSTFLPALYSFLSCLEQSQWPHWTQVCMENLQRLEDMLKVFSQGPFFLGSVFSVADIILVPFFVRFTVLFFNYRSFLLLDPDRFPLMCDWYHNMRQRKSLRLTCPTAEFILESYSQYAHKGTQPISDTLHTNHRKTQGRSYDPSFGGSLEPPTHPRSTPSSVGFAPSSLSSSSSSSPAIPPLPTPSFKVSTPIGLPGPRPSDASHILNEYSFTPHGFLDSSINVSAPSLVSRINSTNGTTVAPASSSQDSRAPVSLPPISQSLQNPHFQRP